MEKINPSELPLVIRIILQSIFSICGREVSIWSSSNSNLLILTISSFALFCPIPSYDFVWYIIIFSELIISFSDNSEKLLE